MSDELPIHLQGASKQYVKYDDTPMLVTAAFRFRNRSKRSRMWAVRDVDLQVERGACVGVIGRNGSGKSTLLQMIAGVTAPTEGTVSVYGRVAPLISVGVGFSPELTGRENVFVNGTILGMTRKQIEQRLDAIIDFSEISDFIDTPVKFYSSGMTVRLGFSVAIHSEPEVLLVDEVLAVGDIAFQWKSFDRMMQIRQSGSTILVVTHNLNAVRKLCERTVVLHGGTKRHDGDTPEAISLFHELMDEHRDIDEAFEDDSAVAPGTARIESVTLLDSNGRPTANVGYGKPVTLRVVVAAEKGVENPTLGLAIHNERGVAVYSDSNQKYGGMRSLKAGERQEIDVAFEMRLVTGSYSVAFRLVGSDLSTILAQSRPVAFYVSGRSMVHGVADLGASFAVHQPELSPTAGAEAGGAVTYSE